MCKVHDNKLIAFIKLITSLISIITSFNIEAEKIEQDTVLAKEIIKNKAI